jgi:hypothetical protein
VAFRFDGNERWLAGSFLSGDIHFIERMNTNKIRISPSNFDVVEWGKIIADLRGDRLP